MRAGDHPSFGRLVFDWPSSVAYRVEEAEGRLVLRFGTAAAFDLGALRRPPRNVLGVTAEATQAEIRLAPNTRTRHFRLGNRVVVDVLDADAPRNAPAAAPASVPAAQAQPAPAATAAQQAPATAAQPPTSRPSAPTARAATTPAATLPAATTPAPAERPARAATPPRGQAMPFQPASPPPPEAPVRVEAAPRIPVQQESLPAATPPAAAPAPASPALAAPAGPRLVPVRLMPGPALSIPAAAEVGAALFRRGGIWMVVLDAPLPLDLAALRANPALAGAETSTGPDATTLRLPAAGLRTPRLRREGNAWLLDNPAEEAPLRALLPEVEPGPPARLLLRAAAASGSVSVLDPETGTALLVGTVREGAEAVPLGRRAAVFDLLPTRLGAALLPRADTVTLRALPGRFLAGAAAGAELALGPEVPGAAAAVAAAAMTRSFDLPAEAPAALQERLRNATAAVAAAAPLGRGAPRLRAAEALLALGLPQEAQSMISLAMQEDPVVAEAPRARGLLGIAALLGGRLPDAAGLDHPRLPENDEIRLWRGLLASARGQDGPGNAKGIAASMPLLLSYPEPLQARLAPLVAEALLAGGEAEAARRLLATREAEEPSLLLARARLLEAEGEVQPALAAYDRIARGRDRRARAIAMRRAAELRLAQGLLDAAGAAAALEATLAAWRGDAMETEARSRLAELRQQAGDSRGAFDLLRETAALFPDLAAGLRPRQVEALLGAIDREPPMAAVVLYDAHADMLPPGEATEHALGALADRLAALDLLDRAGHVLRRAMTRSTDREAKARLGARLAGLALGAGDNTAALAALQETEAPGLSPELTRSRLLLRARAQARAGQAAAAMASYREAGPAGAAELAVLLEEKQDWAGAAAALRQHLETLVPPPPAPLPEAQKSIVARIAALLTLAGDESGLAALRAEEQTRMSDGPLSEAFTLFTSGRVAGLGDLPRLREELDTARGLPSRLDRLREETAPTR
ncbi:hypothetical protein [Falsiroseomonas tokyonensis]|uniref:Tetratricopeptide repeat protein n=1 Tax=Falsiroseomonas tokyonensis TaxID=430521 RepID=A0ABV7BT93_9PROT|nr:hypothetical protein [Falsiroseomonas tokyonensis]MBU8537670.1 hypothetical protein [Falsiroseomonas tokyonensis]